MKALLLTTAALLAATAATPAEAQPSSAGKFSLRVGADTRPLVGSFQNELITIADKNYAYLGINVVPSFRLVDVLALELIVNPRIPLNGGDVQLAVGPGVMLDLYLVYVRAALPFTLTSETRFNVEGAAGISFLGKGYFGATVLYTPADEAVAMGAEVGWRFDIGG